MCDLLKQAMQYHVVQALAKPHQRWLTLISLTAATLTFCTACNISSTCVNILHALTIRQFSSVLLNETCNKMRHVKELVHFESCGMWKAHFSFVMSHPRYLIWSQWLSKPTSNHPVQPDICAVLVRSRTAGRLLISTIEYGVMQHNIAACLMYGKMTLNWLASIKHACQIEWCPW